MATKIIPGGEKPEATLHSVVVDMPDMTPKRAVVRYDSRTIVGDHAPVMNLYLRAEAWKALGEPDGVRLTIEPLR